MLTLYFVISSYSRTPRQPVNCHGSSKFSITYRTGRYELILRPLSIALSRVAGPREDQGSPRALGSSTACCLAAVWRRSNVMDTPSAEERRPAEQASRPEAGRSSLVARRCACVGLGPTRFRRARCRLQRRQPPCVANNSVTVSTATASGRRERPHALVPPPRFPSHRERRRTDRTSEPDHATAVHLLKQHLCATSPPTPHLPQQTPHYLLLGRASRGESAPLAGIPPPRATPPQPSFLRLF
ncbi:hypothetical protein HPB50_000380 [Hyalomma asiaticum]|uniref:Uncharacterized protein n=1 Tax=Hyalomma asiaticum TaxID=266040 RepID=A0ACB7SCH1_HYAAI|nr:hypothetical protein HPB50_000380 [Hyalomma asiaticum]